MIPKKIHYCWFGGKKLDEKAEKCIASWKKFFPGYEIIQWNESNFDIAQIDFMRKAYEDKKWAFVSDVARLIVIYNYGGIYFDTDVEIIKAFDDILNDKTVGFWGMEQTAFVNSGLGFGCEARNELIGNHIKVYQELNYEDYKDKLSTISCPRILTPLLEREGFIRINQKQIVAGFEVYPSDFFSPIDYETGKMAISTHTHSIHWFAASWEDDASRMEKHRIRFFTGILGKSLGNIVYGIESCIRTEGIGQYCYKRMRKLWGKLKK